MGFFDNMTKESTIMTYLESITYLTGNFIQVSQFVLRNAYRVISLTAAKNKENAYLSGGMSQIEAAEAIANAYILQNKGMGLGSLLKFFEIHPGLSKKDSDDLRFVLNKREYLISFFYIENSNRLAMEDVAVYESVIRELKEYIEKANNLNLSLSKACDKLYQAF